MRKFLTPTSILFALVLFISSCTDDVNPVIPEEKEEVTFIEHTLSADLGTLGTLDFDYDECNIQVSNSYGSVSLNGTSYDKITFKHILRQNGLSLLINPVFLIDQSSDDTWASILDTDINDQSNPYFGLEIEVQESSRNYTSTSSATINGQYYPFVYPDDFQYDLSYEKEVSSECNEEALFKLYGSISGTLTNRNSDGTTDSIQIDISDFELYFIP